MSDLSPTDELPALLKKIPAWESEDGKTITRTIEFEEFMEGIEFVGTLAEIAEEAFHHPDIDIRYTNVTIALTTHEQGGITAADLEMAQRIDRLVD